MSWWLLAVHAVLHPPDVFCEVGTTGVADWGLLQITIAALFHGSWHVMACHGSWVMVLGRLDIADYCRWLQPLKACEVFCCISVNWAAARNPYCPYSTNLQGSAFLRDVVYLRDNLRDKFSKFQLGFPFTAFSSSRDHHSVLEQDV